MASGPSKWTRTGPGTYKDQYGNVLQGQSKPPTRNMAPPAGGAGPSNKPPGSLGKDPKTTAGGGGSQTQTQQNIPTRADNLALYNALTPEQQARYRRLRRNRGVAEANKFLMNTAPQPTAAPQPATPEEITEQGFRGSADLYGSMMERFKGFDPMQVQAQYNPVFSQEMERARQNVMGQFERRNAEEFARQQEDVQRQIVERGLDPNSPAAQALYKQLNVRQDLARQEAMSAAEQAAQGVQQQYFGQAMGIAQQPYDIFGSTFAPVYQTGIAAQYGQQQLGLQQQFEAEQQRRQLASAERIARMSRGGGGGGAPQLTPFERMEIESLTTGYPTGQQPNPGAQIVSGAVTGATGQITGNLNRR